MFFRELLRELPTRAKPRVHLHLRTAQPKKHLDKIICRRNNREMNKSPSCGASSGITARTKQNGRYLRHRPRPQQGPRGLHRQGRQHQLHDGVAAPRQQVSTDRSRDHRHSSFPVVARTPPETARFDDENGAGLSDRRGLTSSPSPPMFSARRPCPSRPGVSAAVAHVDPSRSLCLSTTGMAAGDPGRLPRIVSVVLRPAMLDSVVDDSLARVCRRAMRQSTSSEAYRAGSGPRRRAFLAEPPIRGVWAPIKSIALYFFQFAFRR